MKSVTEFPNFKLLQGLKTKSELTAAGKTPEEITAQFGETYKLEGEKLTYFLNAVEVASQNTEKLVRVKVVQFNEGESAPPKAVKIEEHTYIPEFQKEAGKVFLGKPQKGGGNNQKKKDGPKESPWGMSPEQIAAKKAGGNKASKPTT